MAKLILSFPKISFQKINIPIISTYTSLMQEQYIFIHDAILKSVMCGDTEINATNFRSTLMKMTRKNMEDNSTKLETQFKV